MIWHRTADRETKRGELSTVAAISSSAASYRVRSTSLAVICVGNTPTRKPVAFGASGFSSSNSSPRELPPHELMVRHVLVEHR